MGLYFGAICLQETWLASDADLSLLQLPGYNIIHQGSKCTKHRGLIIYLSEMYSFKLRNLCNDSDIWEGLFIDVMGHNLRKPLTICNIYRPPNDNNNNDNISKYLSELSPVLDILQKENSYAAIVGDFNINLLQINEREKFEDFFDLMCTNSFYPKITLPTRFSKHSCSLIDQMFCKVPHKDHKNISSSIVVSNISDHFPCIVKVDILRESNKPPKYIYVRTANDTAINNFRNDLLETDIASIISSDLTADPNSEYAKFERIITTAYQKHFPEKRVKFNKYKHKLSDWITSGILKSIEFRGELYRRLNTLSSDSPDYELVKYNLKIYNRYLNQCIRIAKKIYYAREFAKYKGDIRKTWDTLKDILNKKKRKSKFPAYFLCNNKHVSGAQNIANKFNEYFTNIGRDLASSIDTSIKLHSILISIHPAPIPSCFNTPILLILPK